MAHTYSSNFVHCVFSTKERLAMIPAEKQEKLWAYLTGIATNHRFQILAVGGIPNHVHVLMAVPPAMAVAEAVRELKANSSRWLNDSSPGFAWQEGYGAFSVSSSQVPVLKAYIHGQAEHHDKRTFEDEFLALLKKCGVDYDPKYVFG